MAPFREGRETPFQKNERRKKLKELRQKILDRAKEIGWEKHLSFAQEDTRNNNNGLKGKSEKNEKKKRSNNGISMSSGKQDGSDIHSNKRHKNDKSKSGKSKSDKQKDAMANRLATYGL